MDTTINLCEILKNCPEGTELWSDNYGVVQFKCIVKNYIGPINYPILVNRSDGHNVYYTKEGWSDKYFPASCLLWPSKDCRDWSKFNAPWHKKERFDPNTFKPFDKVLARDDYRDCWFCKFFSHIIPVNKEPNIYRYGTTSYSFKYCIPYNDDTKHLIGTKDEAPEYYRYWEE